MLQKFTVDSILEMAKDAGASGQELDKIEKFRAFEEMLDEQSYAALCYWYSKSIIEGPWPPGEPAIAGDPRIALKYSIEVIKGRWEPGEAAIARDADCSIDYAIEVIKGRWEPGEAAIYSKDTPYGIAMLYRNFVKAQRR